MLTSTKYSKSNSNLILASESVVDIKKRTKWKWFTWQPVYQKIKSEVSCAYLNKRTCFWEAKCKTLHFVVLICNLIVQILYMYRNISFRIFKQNSKTILTTLPNFKFFKCIFKSQRNENKIQQNKVKQIINNTQTHFINQNNVKETEDKRDWN